MTGQLALFENDKRGNERAPDAKGVGDIDGAKVEVAAWWRVSKAGKKYLSVAISQPRERQAVSQDPPPPRPTVPPPGSAPATTEAAANSADDIPF